MRVRGAIVVTGTSTGIGDACARRLAIEGFRVFAGVRREEDARRLRTVSDRVTPLILDVTDERGIGAAAALVDAQTGEAGVAGLVNNAGVVVPGPLEYLPLDDLRRQLEVNVIGAVAVTQAFLPLVRRGRGRLVFVGSIAGRMAVPFLGPYAASKSALDALCDALRGELAPWRLPVILIEPGEITTPIWEKGHALGQELRARLPDLAIRRYGRAIAALEVTARAAAARGRSPDTVADVVVHALASPRPRTRYLVGADARARAWVARLPDRARDVVLRRALGLPRPGDGG